MSDKNILVQYRKKVGKSQREVAEICGVNAVVLSRYERGEAIPKADTIAKLGRFYQLGWTPTQTYGLLVRAFSLEEPISDSEIMKIMSNI